MASSRRAADRFLATVVFTDIVDSTRLATELGDRAWGHLLEQHHELIRRQLRVFGGREVDTAGDGFFALFDAPARAVACALTIVELVPDLGIQVRAGIHTGEVEEAKGDLRGIGVHIGSRIGAAAEAGEVLTSATVRDLVAGSAVEFEDRGTRELKGVAGEWHVFAAHRGARFREEFVAREGAAPREVASIRRTLQRRRRRRRVIVGATALVAAAAAGAVLFLVTRGAPSLPGVDENTAAIIDPASGRIVAQVAVGGRPDGIAVGEGAIWVANSTDGTVSRIDPQTRGVVQSIEVGGAPSGLAVGFGAIWVANSDDRTVSRINALTNRVVQTIGVGNGPTGVAVGGGAVWVTNAIDGTLSRIDGATGTVTSTTNVGASPEALAADDVAVWVADLDSGTVSKVDPGSGRVVASVAVGNGPRAVAIGDTAVWVANSGDGTASRIDPASGRVTATIVVGEGASGVAASAGAVWVACAADGAVYRVDPQTNTATRIAVGSSPQNVALTADQLWFTARASAASHRGGTLNVVGGAPFDSIDPATIVNLNAAALLGMTNDGLVGFERTGGIGGATLVPNLATSLPNPADGGTSYTFELRPGLTYSDGQPIKPEDFRRAIERAYKVPFSFGEVGVPFYDGIVGADACLTTPASCDLSRGIVADVAGNTVTFHLTTPDSDFLEKLALWAADAVPASVSDIAVSEQPVPATGPYMIASYTPSEIRLVRNPLFHEWSHSARPDAYADEIVWAIGPDVNEQLDMVLDGSADVMWLKPEPGRMAQLQAQFPGQFHPWVHATTWFLMNTSLPPFDDLGVRRAVNLAVDRERVVELLGGSFSAQVTCQILPPNAQGYAPYCPYTTDPNPAGTWTAPDVATARDLVAASGRSGTPVVVLAGPEYVDLAGYMVEVLNDLGFAASLRAQSDQGAYFEELHDPVRGPLVQATVLSWLADYPTAAATFFPTFRCQDPDNFARFCDPSVAAQIQAAVDLQQADPAAAGQRWSAVDRAIVDLAPAAALANKREADFVSARVGNYQHNPQWRILLDQLWVQ